MINWLLLRSFSLAHRPEPRYSWGMKNTLSNPGQTPDAAAAVTWLTPIPKDEPEVLAPPSREFLFDINTLSYLDVLELLGGHEGLLFHPDPSIYASRLAHHWICLAGRPKQKEESSAGYAALEASALSWARAHASALSRLYPRLQDGGFDGMLQDAVQSRYVKHRTPGSSLSLDYVEAIVCLQLEQDEPDGDHLLRYSVKSAKREVKRIVLAREAAFVWSTIIRAVIKGGGRPQVLTYPYLMGRVKVEDGDAQKEKVAKAVGGLYYARTGRKIDPNKLKVILRWLASHGLIRHQYRDHLGRVHNSYLDPATGRNRPHASNLFSLPDAILERLPQELFRAQKPAAPAPPAAMDATELAELEAVERRTRAQCDRLRAARGLPPLTDVGWRNLEKLRDRHTKGETLGRDTWDYLRELDGTSATRMNIDQWREFSEAPRL